MGILQVCVVLGCFLACLQQCSSLSKGGIQLRLTDKALDYAMRLSMDKLQTDLRGKRLNIKSQKSGKARFEFRDPVIQDIRVPGYDLSPLKDVGFQASVSHVSVSFRSGLHYSYKVWIAKFSDTVNVKVDTHGAKFKINVKVGRRSDGRPFTQLQSCDADVGNLKIRFSGSLVSWLYNAAARIFRGKIKRKINEALCKTLTEEINEKANKQLAAVKVIAKLDKVAVVDYSLSMAPKFTSNYMDAFIVGAFRPRHGQYTTQLTVPSYPAKADSKMIYLWLTEYTFNTAGEVYHKSGILKEVLNLKTAPGLLRPFLHTNSYGRLAPGLTKKYPGHAMDLLIETPRPPKIIMKPNNASLLVSIRFNFRVLTKERPVNAIGFDLKIVIHGNIRIKKGYLVGVISGFRFYPSISYSLVGKVDIPPFVLKQIFSTTVLRQVKPKFEGGLPLPSFDQVDLINTSLKVMQGYLVIATDCKYKGL